MIRICKHAPCIMRHSLSELCLILNAAVGLVLNHFTRNFGQDLIVTVDTRGAVQKLGVPTRFWVNDHGGKSRIGLCNDAIGISLMLGVMTDCLLHCCSPHCCLQLHRQVKPGES